MSAVINFGLVAPSGLVISQKGTRQRTHARHASYALPWEFEIGAGGYYTGRRYSSTDNLREAEGYWTFDAMISKQFTKNIKAQINVYNLFDETYIRNVNNNGGRYNPGYPRSAMVTSQVRF